MDYNEYSAEVDRQIFGDMNFKPGVNQLTPIIFISDADRQISISPELTELLGANSDKLTQLVNAVKEDRQPPVILTGSPKTVIFYDDVREKDVQSPGFVYFADRDVIAAYARAA